MVCWSSAAVAGQRLRPDGRTFEKLAIEESVPRRHVNNLVRRAELRVREGLATSSAPLPWVVSTLRTRLGTAATQRQVASARRHTAPSRIGPPPQGWNTLSTNSCLSEVEQEAKSLGDGVHLVDRHVTQFLTKPLKRNGSELVATGIGVVL